MEEMTMKQEGVVSPSDKTAAKEISSKKDLLLEDTDLGMINAGYEKNIDKEPNTGHRPYIPGVNEPLNTEC